MTDPEKNDAEPQHLRAHQPDGTDSSAELEAQIADQNMIPEDLSE